VDTAKVSITCTLEVANQQLVSQVVDCCLKALSVEIGYIMP